MNTTNPTAAARPELTLLQGFESDLLSRDQAAAYLGIAVQTLAVWKSAQRYDLPVVKVGRLVKYRRSELDAFIRRRTVR